LIWRTQSTDRVDAAVFYEAAARARQALAERETSHNATEAGES